MARSIAGALALAGLEAGCVHLAGGATGLVDPSTGRIAAEASARGGMIMHPEPTTPVAPVMGLQVNGGYDGSRERAVVTVGPFLGMHVLGDPLGMHAQLQFEAHATGDGRAFAFSLRSGPTLTVVRDPLDRSLVTLDAVTRLSFGEFEQWQLGLGLSFDRLVWPPPDARFH